MRLRLAAIIMLLFSVLLLSESCITRKDISYFQDITDSTKTQPINRSFDAIIQPGDILSIHVTSLSPEASSFFNVTGESMDQQVANTYLVNADGNVEMPLIGQIKVAGNTSPVAKFLIRNKLEKYLADPTVSIRIRNFKVTVLGEVQSPGVYTIPNEKITLIEALGLAGDLTIFAQRSNVLIIREKDGQRQFMKIDLRSKEFFESEFYYLHSNDVVYVEPGKGRIASADAWYRILPIVLSGLSTIALFLRFGGTL